MKTVRFKSIKDISQSGCGVSTQMEKYFDGEEWEIVRMYDFTKDHDINGEYEYCKIVFVDEVYSWWYRTDWIVDNSPQVCYDDVLNMFKEEL